MKRLFFLVLCCICIVFSLPAQSADLVYLDGWVDLKRAGGDLEEAFFGDVIQLGDSVITGEDGTAELAQGASSHIIISSDTVFTLMQAEYAGKKQTVLSCTLGSITCRFQKLTEEEPMITSPSMVAGVRGTEFTVFTASDGSSLIAVESGQVDVESAGITVSLIKEEGVEVRPGEAPGEKFTVLRGQIEYGAWNEEKLAAFLEDPVSALERIESRLDEYMSKIYEYNDHKARLDQAVLQERAKLETIKAEQGEDAMKEHYRTVIQPMEREAAFSVLNYRFYALSALSLRRHLMSGLYVTMKTQFLSNPTDEGYMSFLDVYERLLKKYEEGVVPYLVETDF